MRLDQFRSPTRLAHMLAPDQNSFGVIRLAMAIAVLMSHSYWFTTGSKIADPLVGFTGHSIGEHAVQVFFFLSGILVTQSLMKSRSVLNYGLARALRIFPALIVCVALTAFILGPLFTHAGLLQYATSSQLPLYIIKTLMLITGSAPLPGLFSNQPLPDVVNVSLWTLKYEVICYIGLGIFGGAALLNDRLRPYATIALALFVALIFIGQPKPLDTYTFADNLRYFALYFYAGTLAYLWRDRIPVSGLVLLPFAGLYALCLGTRLGELTCCLLLGYATLWISTFTFGPLRAFTNRHDYSYGVYIYAGPIQQLVVHLLPDYGPTAVSLHALSITLPLAVFSWELIEHPAISIRQPLLAWLNSLVGRRPWASHGDVVPKVENAVSPMAIRQDRLRLATAVRKPKPWPSNVTRLSRRAPRIRGQL